MIRGPALAACLGFALAPAPARSQACLVAGSETSFGVYDGFGGDAARSNGSVSVTCTAALPTNVSYGIALGGGTGGNIADRRLSNGPAELRYQLFTDAAYSRVWGDGSGGSFVVSDSYRLSALGTVVRNYPIFGRIPGNQLTAPGVYTDAIVLTLNF